MRNHHAGRPERRKVVRPIRGGICSEHVITIYKLYEYDGMTLDEIAALYGTQNSSICKLLQRMRAQMQDKDDWSAARYMARAEQYGEVLRLLDEKRGMTYRAIHLRTRLSVPKIIEIARRNGLER